MNFGGVVGSWPYDPALGPSLQITLDLRIGNNVSAASR